MINEGPSVIIEQLMKICEIGSVFYCLHEIILN